MQPEINMIAPAAFAVMALASMWFAANALQAKPDSGILIAPENNAIYSHIS